MILLLTILFISFLTLRVSLFLENSDGVKIFYSLRSSCVFLLSKYGFLLDIYAHFFYDYISLPLIIRRMK